MNTNTLRQNKNTRPQRPPLPTADPRADLQIRAIGRQRVTGSRVVTRSNGQVSYSLLKRDIMGMLA